MRFIPLILILALALAFAMPVHATSKTVIGDTFAQIDPFIEANNGNATQLMSYYINSPYGSGSRVGVSLSKFNTTIGATTNSYFTNWLINTLNFTMNTYTTSGYGWDGSCGVYQNQTWDENTFTSSDYNSSYFVGSSGLDMGVNELRTADMKNNYWAMLEAYKAQNITLACSGLTSVHCYLPYGACGFYLQGTEYGIFSKEYGFITQNTMMNFTRAYFKQTTHNYAFEQNDSWDIYYNFITQAQTTDVGALPYTWHYDLSNNQLITGASWKHFQLGWEANNYNDDTLDFVSSCYEPLGYVNTDPVIDNLGTLYDSNGHMKAEYICFNLTDSASFGGAGQNGYYGIMKIVNDTRAGFAVTGHLDYFITVVAPIYTTFSEPVVTPSIINPNTNVTITWETSKPLTTELSFYTILPNGNPTASILLNNSNLTNTHSITINSANIYTAYYNYTIQGYDNESNLHYPFNITDSSQLTYNFTVGYIGVFTEPNATVPSVIQNNPMFPNADVGMYVFGLAIIGLFTTLGFIIGGMQLGITVFVSMLTAFSSIGILPLFLLIPVGVLFVVILVRLFSKVLFGEGAGT